ncbi:hypothetical protein [Methanocella arvoryzae]|uniref:hypothetical protein n=1 Tax=Methanocella arvoryzae TaxID=1175445 RepID=UPI00064F1FF4|nr:hypothetical protein [Methanocella arvoryzae]
MKQTEYHMRPPGQYGATCECPACGELQEGNKKIFTAMVFFGVMAIANLFIVGLLHLMLHARATLHGQ